jgi:hypothetical protein
MNVLTGEPIIRAPRYSPRIENVLATIHPAFLTSKSVPDDYLSQEELVIGAFLEDYDITMPSPPKTASLGGERFGLTFKEQNKFIDLMTTKERTGYYDSVIDELLFLENDIRSREGTPSEPRSAHDFRADRKEIESLIRGMKEEVNKQILPDVTIRLYKTPAGRERLWSTLNRNKLPWKDDAEHREILKQIIEDSDFWVGDDVRALKIP